MAEKKEMSIAEACKAINYTPEPKSWAKKSDKEKWAAIKAKRVERAARDAKNVLAAFVTDKAFKALPEKVQAAITTIAVRKTGGGGGGSRTNVFMVGMAKLIPGVGKKADGIKIFMELKMGTGEIRAKVRENLLKAAPENRHWYEVIGQNADGQDIWSLLAVGEKQPEGWKGKAID